ncbi:hypothetical protein HDU96_008216 [Phlyctochytrium bullatum]|nr:hypothetical protein HDU96_008216 [Phlyctochytrium bullatum]
MSANPFEMEPENSGISAEEVPTSTVTTEKAEATSSTSQIGTDIPPSESAVGSLNVLAGGSNSAAKRANTGRQRPTSAEPRINGSFSEASGTAVPSAASIKAMQAAKRRLSQPIVLTYHPPTGTFQPAETVSGSAGDIALGPAGAATIQGQAGSNEAAAAAAAAAARVDRVRERRAKRNIKHIGQFLRLNVQLSNGLVFDVTVDKSHTIEYLAHQIEAEYAFRNILNALGNAERDENSFEPVQKTFVPLEIGQLYDAGMLALNFSDVIGDVLSFNDTVQVINTYGANLRSKDGETAPVDPDAEDIAGHGQDPRANGLQDSLASMAEAGNSDTANTLRARQLSTATSSQTLDDRLQLLLHSTMGLSFFQQFCVEEYCVENLLFWLTVECLQSCDASLRPVLAKFIYLVYLAPSAPLVINVSPEIKNDIREAFGNPHHQLDIGLFDEAQENVYAVLKGHSFVRFEKGPFNDLFVQTKRQDRPRYIQSKIVGSYADAFQLNLANLCQQIDILEDPTSDAAVESVALLGDGRRRAVNSNDFKELFLHLASSHFFPSQPPEIFHNYFNSVSRMSWASKQKRMQKEKKLAKFFGQRPSNEQLMRQTSTQRRLSITMLMEMNKKPTTADELEMLLSSLQLDGSTDPTLRRKKMEKLETFFGNPIPKQQKVEQSLMAANDEINLVFSTENSDDESSDGEVIQVDNITTINELPPEQRRILNKRNKKLATLLGENLDAKTISKVVTETVNISKMALPTSESVGGGIAALAAGDDDDDLEAEFGTVEEGVEGAVPGTIIVKKKRLDKLSSMLGERIKVNDVSDSLATTASSQASAASIGRVLPPPRALTPQERKQVQKRANKIEKLMGALPPTQALLSTIKETSENSKLVSEPAKKIQEGIVSISYFIQNTKDVVDLLETLSVVSNEVESRRVSTVSEDDDEMAGETKESRQRRINKLRKFFGNEIDVIELIESQLLLDIEQTVDEIPDQNEREFLKENMKSLRVIMNRRSVEIEAEYRRSVASIGAAHVAGGGGDHVYITSTVSSPDHAHVEAYTPRSTRPLISPTAASDGNASTVRQAPPVMDEASRRQSVTRKEIWD